MHPPPLLPKSIRRKSSNNRERHPRSPSEGRAAITRRDTVKSTRKDVSNNQDKHPQKSTRKKPLAITRRDTPKTPPERITRRDIHKRPWESSNKQERHSQKSTYPAKRTSSVESGNPAQKLRHHCRPPHLSFTGQFPGCSCSSESRVESRVAGGETPWRAV